MLDTATTTTATDTLADPGETARNSIRPMKAPRSTEDLLVLPISDHEWRVTDRRLAPNDAHSVLGVIDRKDDGLFEVLQLAPSLAWRWFSSLDDATASFARFGRR